MLDIIVQSLHVLVEVRRFTHHHFVEDATYPIDVGGHSYSFFLEHLWG
jgi:hypothetical protein